MIDDTDCQFSAPARHFIRIAASIYILCVAAGLIHAPDLGPLFAEVVGPDYWPNFSSILIGLLALPLISVRWHLPAALTLLGLFVMATPFSSPTGPSGSMLSVSIVLLILIATHLNQTNATEVQDA